jgi:hypothetical protein
MQSGASRSQGAREVCSRCTELVSAACWLAFLVLTGLLVEYSLLGRRYSLSGFMHWAMRRISAKRYAISN